MSPIFNVRKLVKIIFSLLVLLLGFFFNPFPIQAGSAPHSVCLRLTAEFNLLEYSAQGTDEQNGILDAGDGVTMILAPLNVGDYANSLTLQDQGHKVTTIKAERLFSTCFRLEMGKTRYWVVETWTCGAHCCFTHYYFCRPADGLPVCALGGVNLGHSQATTRGVFPISKTAALDKKLPSSNIDKLSANLSQEQIICPKGQTYIHYMDNRFAYGMEDFETSYAGSKVMFFPVFYQLSPNGLQLSNKSFKEEYLQRIALLDKAICDIGAKGPHFTATKGYVGFYAADALWILITARTINYLVAREESRAWQTLERDVKKYYGTVKGLEKLKKKIKATVAAAPY